MELITELKSFKNAGGSVYSSIGSSGISKTTEYKLINNLPKFAEGTPGLLLSSTSSSTSNTAMPSVTNISSGPSLTGGFGSTTSSFGSSLGTIQNSLTSPNGSQLLDLNSFGGSNYRQPAFAPMIDWSSGSLRAAAIGLVGALANSIGSGNPIDLNKSNLILLNSIGGSKRVGPGSTGGKGINVGAIGGAITSTINFAGDAINSFQVNETGDEIAQKYGTSQQNVGGIGYESQNMIDLNKEMDRIKKDNLKNTLVTVGSGAAAGAAIGAAAGSVVPGIGTAIGALVGLGLGLWGGASRKREYRRMLAKQNSKINALQDSARFSAQTKAIQQMNAREYGNSEALYLYGAADGKQPEVNPNTRMTKDDFLLTTPDGYKIGKANALTEPGETLFNTKTGSMMLNPRQISGKLHPGDIQPSEIPEHAAVFTDRHKDPITGKSFALAAIDGDDDPYNLLYRQKVLVNDKKNNKGLMKAKNGRLPKFDNGWVGNAITSGIGALGGLSLWLEAKNSTPKKTNSYRANPYEGVSLDILSRLGISPFPTMQNLRNAEARANRAIDMSGGLTTGQRTLTRLASLNNTQRAVADALLNIQMQNNNYFADYAKTALAAGAANAQRAMLANMYDEEMYAKAHAARQLGMQMGMRNIVDLLNNFYANEFKRKQFNETMSLYKQDQLLRADEILAIINNINSNKTSNEKYSYANSISPTYLGNYGLKKDLSIASNSRLKNPKLFWGKDYSLTAPILPTSYTTYKYIKPYDNIRLR